MSLLLSSLLTAAGEILKYSLWQIFPNDVQDLPSESVY